MAGINASEIRVAGTGHILVAPKNTPAPEDFSQNWPPEWIVLGYTTVDGVKFVKKDKLDEVEAWQAVAPVRYVFQERVFSAEFALLQVNADTLPFFFGGATVTTDALGGTRVEVPAAPQPDERALGIEFSDGPDVKHRFVIPRGIVTENEEVELTRSGAIELGVTFTAMMPDTAEAEPLAFWHMKQPPETGTTAASRSTFETADSDSS